VTCAWGEFGSAAPVANVSSSSSEIDPWLSHDGLTLYFTSDREGGAGGWDIWAAARVSPSSSFGLPAPVSEVNSAEEDTGADLSSNGLMLFFASGRAGGLGGSDLWYASRSSSSDPFDAPVHISTPNSDVWDADPAVSLDRLTLYFASRRGGSGDRNLWMAVRADSADAFGAPEPLTALNSMGDDYDPAISVDGRELYFSTDRDEQRDVWVARRADVGQPFDSAEPVAAINTDEPGVDGGVADNEWSPGISPDGRTLYFVTDRAGLIGSGDIWSATRICP
jgi:Tol biopolymer transport system component